MSAAVAASGLYPLLAEIPHTHGAGPSERKIYIFSKHLQWLDYEKMAETAVRTGFDGVDLTVRPKGHVLPENVRKDLPRAIKAIRKSGLLADRMTTAIISADDPLTVDILETASELGVTNYRMGWLNYDPVISVQENLEKCKTQLAKLAGLNKRYGLKAAYQNNAGEGVGGPVWDIGVMLDGIDNAYIGVRYDIRHATVEGGKSWPVSMKYIADRINSFDIKDFIWKEIDGTWQPFNVQIGDGMVDFERYYQLIKEHHIQGDFTLHLEYPIGGAEHGATELSDSPEVVISAMKHDLSKLRELISH
jgi:sugar phosphate isomerase/epimerase